MAIDVRDREDAHNGIASVEHLRVVSPPRSRWRPDAVDFLIWGGWIIACGLFGALMTVLIYSLD